jgi:Mor family transcriptional regulator
VEVTGQLSNQGVRSRIGQLHSVVLGQCAGKCAERTTTQSPPLHGGRQIQHRLRSEETERLVADYQTGARINELATRYRVNRATVIQHVNRSGVRRHYPALLPHEVEEAARLYREGQSLALVSSHFGVHATTVRTALLRAGLRMRDSQGREQ